MYLIQILLPIRDNLGVAFGPEVIETITLNLSKRYGGITAYTRAPAEGRWETGGTTQHDDVLVVEVMVDAVDRLWWSRLRTELEHKFRQERVVIRAQTIELL